MVRAVKQKVEKVKVEKKIKKIKSTTTESAATTAESATSDDKKKAKKVKVQKKTLFCPSIFITVCNFRSKKKMTIISFRICAMKAMKMD
jgi:hypothetical protein